MPEDGGGKDWERGGKKPDKILSDGFRELAVFGGEADIPEMPTISDEELGSLCDIEFLEDLSTESVHLFEAAIYPPPENQEKAESKEYRWEVARGVELMKALVGRDIPNELPTSNKDFVYRRSVDIAVGLQKSIARFLVGGMVYSDEERGQLARNAAKLLVMERRKAAWLEDNEYPVRFRRPIQSARSEVQQFLNGLENRNEVVANREQPLEMPVQLLDELNFILQRPMGGSLDSAGIYYRENSIKMRIYNYKNVWEEWHVYLTMVHELVHAITHRDDQRYGLELHDWKMGDINKALNEAVTEIVAHLIASNHLQAYKTHLSGQGKAIFLTDMGYTEYTLIVKQIYSKIPRELFRTALLDKRGYEPLREAFAKAFGEADALLRFAYSLTQAYVEPKKRVPFEETSAYTDPSKKDEQPPDDPSSTDKE